MFLRKNRLTSKKDIERVFKMGRYFFVKDLGIKFIKNNLDYPRFACVVSNKISKKAVERNRIKRRLREILRLAIPDLPQDIDLVVFTRPGIKEIDYHEMEARIHACLKKLWLLK